MINYRNDKETVRDALSFISPNLEREEWVKIGMAVKNGLNGDGFDVFNEWSSGGDSYNKNDCKDTWKSINADGNITLGSLFYIARKNGWNPKAESIESSQDVKPKPPPPPKTKYREQENDKARLKASRLLEVATPAKDDHPYLVRKGIKPTPNLFELNIKKATQIIEIIGYLPQSDGVKLNGRLLIAPVEIDGKLSTVEFIDESGRKSALAGGKKSDGYWTARELPDRNNGGDGETFMIGEGVATVISCQEAISYHALAALQDGNLPKVSAWVKQAYPNARIIILSDVGNGQSKAEQAAIQSNAHIVIPRFNEKQADDFTTKHGKPPTDFNDLHQLAGIQEINQQIKDAQLKESADLKYRTLIDFDKPVYGFPHINEKGKKQSTLANLRHLLKSYGITVAYNELLKTQEISFNNSADNGHVDLISNSGIAHLRSLVAINGLPASILELLPAIFAENVINPVLSWIESKPWDGKDRLRALADTLTVAAEDRHYRDVALLTWLVQCVAAADGARRTTNEDAIPKYELAFILQGEQGIKKTSWFRRLVPKHLGAYIVDGAHLDPAENETVRICISAWICELGELDSTFRRADISRLKAFLSKQTDTLRLPYDRAESQFGRRTSFCGSVNPEQFLNDATGSRRFLPVQGTACDSLHQIDMQQVWAQVWRLYLGGQQWWCCPELDEMLKERHERHKETTPVEELITENFYIDRITRGYGHKHYTATRILIECGINDPKPSQANAVNSYLKKLGFVQSRNTERIRGYWLEKRPYNT